MTQDSDILQYAGAKLKVWLVQLPDGTVPAKEFLDGLDAKARASFMAIFKQLGDTGAVHNRERFRVIETSDKVFEFKVHGGQGWRLWGKFGHGGMYVTHGAVKPTERKLKRETDRAEEIFLQRRSA